MSRRARNFAVNRSLRLGGRREDNLGDELAMALREQVPTREGVLDISNRCHPRAIAEASDGVGPHRDGRKAFRHL